MKGETHDGRDFLEDAVSRGCAGCVLETESQQEAANLLERVESEEVGLVFVGGATGGLACLHDLARHVRRQYDGTVVGITGSCGKTTTRLLVSHLLRGLGRSVHETAGNENNQIGLPQTLLTLDGETQEFCVLELGMDRPGEIAALDAICWPRVRVVTNVGLAHLEGCGGTIHGVARAKQEILDCAKEGDICVLNADDDHVAAMK